MDWKFKKKQYFNPQPKKYGETATERNGRSFASKLEAALYDMLRIRVAAGELKELKCQVHVYLTEARIHMIPDFSALHVEQNTVWYFEAKGCETDVYLLKRKLWTCYGPGPLEIWKGSYKRLLYDRTIIPRRQTTML